MVQKKKNTVTREAVVLDEEKLHKVLGNWKNLFFPFVQLKSADALQIQMNLAVYQVFQRMSMSVSPARF